MNKTIILENSNADIILKLISKLNYIHPNSKWLFSDIDLEIFEHKEYSGIGIQTEEQLMDRFIKNVSNNDIMILRYDEIEKIFKNTISVIFGIIICFDENQYIDRDFKPMVGEALKELPIMKHSLCELRIFEELELDIYIRDDINFLSNENLKV